MAPTIETARLLLRAHRPTDFEDCAAMWASPVVNRYFGVPLTREDAWSKFLRYSGHWAMKGYGFWAVEEKVTGLYVGEVGFADFMREIVPPIGGDPEAGWVLSAWAHGKGFATEAVRAAQAWMEPRAARTFCIIAPENAASVRVAEKCGFRHSGETVYRDRRILVFERLREFRLRLATFADVDRLRFLIERSVWDLQSGDYSQAQLESALRCVYGVDSQLIADGTYFMVEMEGRTVACGGWSKRRTLFGGDQLAGREDGLLDPARDAAKIRAFFVHPDWTRQGLGSLILEACEQAAFEAGFRRFEMGATLTGAALYKARGYEAIEEIAAPLDNGLSLPIVRMGKPAASRQN